MKYHKRASIGSHFNNARQSTPRYEIITDGHWSARRRPRNPRIDRRRRSRTHVSLISYCISSLDAVFINGHAQNNAGWKSEMHMRICHTYRMLATTATTTPATGANVRYCPRDISMHTVINRLSRNHVPLTPSLFQMRRTFDYYY